MVILYKSLFCLPIVFHSLNGKRLMIGTCLESIRSVYWRVHKSIHQEGLPSRNFRPGHLNRFNMPDPPVLDVTKSPHQSPEKARVGGMSPCPEAYI